MTLSIVPAQVEEESRKRSREFDNWNNGTEWTKRERQQHFDERCIAEEKEVNPDKGGKVDHEHVKSTGVT